MAATLVEAVAGDAPELDELWSFVLRREDKRWVWLALSRLRRVLDDRLTRDRLSRFPQPLHVFLRRYAE